MNSVSFLIKSVILGIYDNIRNLAFKSLADFVENIAVITNNLVFIIFINYLKSRPHYSKQANG